MAKNIVIYTGPIHKVFVENVSLVKDKVVPTVGDITVEEKALFYSSYGGYINMEYSCLLADRYEATSYMDSSLQHREAEILRIFADPNISEEEKEQYRMILRSITGCIYYNKEELEPSFSIPKKDFKELRKTIRKSRR